MLKVILECRMPTNFSLISQQQFSLSPAALVKERMCLETYVQAHSLKTVGAKLLIRSPHHNTTICSSFHSYFFIPGLLSAFRNKPRLQRESRQRTKIHNLRNITRRCLWRTVTPMILRRQRWPSGLPVDLSLDT